MIGKFQWCLLLGIGRRVALCAVFCLVTNLQTTAYAGQSKSVIERIVVGREEHQCPIQLVDPYGARVTETRYVLDHFPYRLHGVGELYLSLTCLSSSDEEGIKHAVSARYDESIGQWVEDLSWLEPEEQRATRTFPVHGARDSGWAMTQDAINGDPKTRDRAFAFCLRHPPAALCGYTSQIARPYYKHSDMLPFALKIINSVEFVEMPSDKDHSTTAE